jgi:hypothetical protein
VRTLLAVLILLGPSCAAAGEPDRPRRLVEFGWDEPDTAFLRAHLAEMERTPFDGCVFHANYRDADGKVGNLAWEFWGRRAFTEEELSGAFDDLRALDPRRFRSNFLRFNVTPADLDWFDDFAAILTNARLAARHAREGHAAGILLDTEAYQGKLFDYRKQRHASSKSWDEYAEQARRRGREVMGAFQDGFADLTILLTFGVSLPWRQSDGGKRPLAECEEGLLVPFLDGLIAATKGRARLVDGHELSYGYRDPTRFAEAARTIKEGVLPLVADREAYGRVVSAGFGLWMDYDWREQGWNTDDPSRNYFTPEGFEASVRRALDEADEYVWIYTETPRWWSDAGGPVKLPDAYAEALRRTRSKTGIHHKGTRSTKNAQNSS